MTRKAKRNTAGCISPGCEKKALHRGLCAGCYQSASRKVRAKLTTWAELEKMKLALPDVGRSLSPFMKSYRIKQTARA